MSGSQNNNNKNKRRNKHRTGELRRYGVQTPGNLRGSPQRNGHHMSDSKNENPPRSGDDVIDECNLTQDVIDLINDLFITENGLDKSFIEEPAIRLLEEITPDEATTAINEFVDRYKVASHKILKSKAGYFRGVCQKYWKANREEKKKLLLNRAAARSDKNTPGRISPLVHETIDLLFTPASGLEAKIIDESVGRRLTQLADEEAIEALHEFCSAVMYRQDRIRNMNAYLMNIIRRRVNRSGSGSGSGSQSQSQTQSQPRKNDDDYDYDDSDTKMYATPLSPNSNNGSVKKSRWVRTNSNNNMNNNNNNNSGSNGHMITNNSHDANNTNSKNQNNLLNINNNNNKNNTPRANNNIVNGNNNKTHGNDMIGNGFKNNIINKPTLPLRKSNSIGATKYRVSSDDSEDTDRDLIGRPRMPRQQFSAPAPRSLNNRPPPPPPPLSHRQFMRSANESSASDSPSSRNSRHGLPFSPTTVDKLPAIPGNNHNVHPDEDTSANQVPSLSSLTTSEPVHKMRLGNHRELFLARNHSLPDPLRFQNRAINRQNHLPQLRKVHSDTSVVERHRYETLQNRMHDSHVRVSIGDEDIDRIQSWRRHLDKVDESIPTIVSSESGSFGTDEDDLDDSVWVHNYDEAAETTDDFFQNVPLSRSRVSKKMIPGLDDDEKRQHYSLEDWRNLAKQLGDTNAKLKSKNTELTSSVHRFRTDNEVLKSNLVKYQNQCTQLLKQVGLLQQQQQVTQQLRQLEMQQQQQHQQQHQQQQQLQQQPTNSLPRYTPLDQRSLCSDNSAPYTQILPVMGGTPVQQQSPQQPHQYTQQAYISRSRSQTPQDFHHVAASNLPPSSYQPMEQHFFNPADTQSIGSLHSWPSGNNMTVVGTGLPQSPIPLMAPQPMSNSPNVRPVVYYNYHPPTVLTTRTVVPQYASSQTSR